MRAVFVQIVNDQAVRRQESEWSSSIACVLRKFSTRRAKFERRAAPTIRLKRPKLQRTARLPQNRLTVCP